MPPDTNIPNIHIIGLQSTGKTTLVHKLRSELESWIADTSIDKPQVIFEVARTVLTKHKFTAEDVKSSPDRCLALQQLILKAQALAEKEALQRKYVSPEAALKMQRQPAWIEVKARMANSLIVVCEAGTPWLTDDGVRLMPDSEEAWMQLFDEFCGLLDEVGLQYVVVPRTMLDLLERADFVRVRWAKKWDSVKHDPVN